MTNKCVVKYVNPELHFNETSSLHVPADFEVGSFEIEHSSYEDLHNKAFKSCPKGYECIEPIALRHEVLWRSSRDRNTTTEEDHLVHAIEQGEYGTLKWGKGNLVSLCVDVRALDTGAYFF